MEGSSKIDSLSLVLTAGTGIEQDSQKRIGIKSWVTKLLEIIIVCVCASQDTCVGVCAWAFLCVTVHACVCVGTCLCVCVHVEVNRLILDGYCHKSPGRRLGV